MADAPLILVADDEALILEATADFLESEGLPVARAGSAAEALRQIDQLGDRLGALFVDVDLKSDVTGFEVAAEARRRRPAVGVLYASGAPSPDFAARRVADGLFVEKPYRYAEVAKILGEMIAGAAPR